MIREVLAIANSPAATIVVKATFTTTLALTAAVLARRQRAAVRHVILAAAFGVLLLLPLAAMLAPPVRISVATPAPAAPIAARIGGVSRPVAPPVLPRSPLSWSTILAGAWVGGAIVFLVPVLAGLWQVRAMRRSARPWPGVSVPRRVVVLLHDTLSGPMTCGIFRHAIVLPAAAQHWPSDDLNRALVHEMEHVRRCDWLVNCGARIISAFYWFHPLVWFAWRQLALEAERSCDDAVLQQSEPAAYADQLVALAQRLSNSAGQPPLLAMASRADLAARVGSVLDGRRPRGRAGVFAVALACSFAIAIGLSISPLTLIAAPQATHQPQIRSSISLVNVVAVVTDSNGYAVNGLTAADFAITDDGEPQRITGFEYNNNTYILGYYPVRHYTVQPGSDGTFHPIKVTCTKDPSAIVRARAGYYSSPAPTVSTPPPSVAYDPSVKPPVLIFRKDAQYSEEARKAKYQGTVIMEVEIDTSGQTANIHVVRSLGLGLDENAIEALKQWRFKPASKDGSPVSVTIQVSVDFRLL